MGHPYQWIPKLCLGEKIKSHKKALKEWLRNLPKSLSHQRNEEV